MSEGFANRGVPPELGFHSFITADDRGSITSVHQVPDEAFAHVCDPEGECLCGPQVVFNIFNGVHMAMYRHAPFDAAYYDGLQQDFDDPHWPIDAIDEANFPPDPDDPVG